MVSAFERIVPIISREDNILVNRNGDITFCFRYKGPDIGSLLSEGLDQLTYDFATALSFLPDHSIVHKQDVYIHKKQHTDYEGEKEFLTKAYLKLYNGGSYLAHDSYLFVTKMSALFLTRGYSLGLEGEDIKDVKSQSKENKSKQWRDICLFENKLKGWIKFMGDSGMKVTALKEEETDMALEGYFALYDSDFFGDLDFTNQKIGFKYFEFLSVGDGEGVADYLRAERLNPDYRRFSREVTDLKGTRQVGLYSDYMCSLGYSLKCNHIVNQYFFVDGKGFWNKEIEKRKKNFGAWRFFSTENGMRADALSEFEEDTLLNNELIIRSHVNVLFWAEDRDLSLVRESLRSSFKELGIVAKINSKNDVRVLFLAGCPGNGGVLPYEDTFIGHASTLTSLALKESVEVDEIKKNVKGLLFTDRTTGLLIQRDCWFRPYETKQITNRNFLGVGKTGSGKSSMTIEVIRQYLAMNFNCTVLDIGRSFEVLAKSHDGNYIVYEDGLGLGVNPFAFSGNKMDNSLLEFLAQFTAVLWRPNTELSDDQMNALEKVILASYKGKRDTSKTSGFIVDGNYEKSTIKDLFSFVDGNKKNVKELVKGNDNFFDIDSFLLSIEKFVEGKFDQLFTSNDTVDVKKNLTVWELDNVKDHKTLFPILSMLITYMTTEVIWKNTSQEKIVLIEEAWKMLEKPGMSNYIKWLYKTIRKFDGAVGVNIQQVGDLNVPGTNIKETVLANSDVKFIMSHTPTMAKELAIELGWSDYELGLLLSIPLDEEKMKNSSGRRFSELISVVGDDVRALQLMVSKEQIANFMSEMKDKKKLFDLVDKHGGDWQKGIEAYVAVYG